MSKYNKCLVLDSSYIPRSIISTERAFVISYKGNADIVKAHPESFKLINPTLDIKKPSIIRVFKYVNKQITKVPLSRENVFKRDGYCCVYCGDDHKKTLTLDHVIPQSKGGKDSWENLVTACKKCNLQKSDLTLKEFGKEIPQPRRPHYLMLMKQVTYIPKEWKDYLFY
jgi:5-methylcytosine-specific restriction endonuclease McrA